MTDAGPAASDEAGSGRGAPVDILKHRPIGPVLVILVLAIGAGWFALGGPDEPIAKLVSAAVAVGSVALVIHALRQPAPQLAISVDEIPIGRPDAPRWFIRRDATGGRIELQLRPGFGWHLVPEGDAPTIHVAGFDPDEIRQVAELHGWTVTTTRWHSTSKET
jgi:hypothetical protein